jgi:hypothetical protein
MDGIKVLIKWPGVVELGLFCSASG